MKKIFSDFATYTKKKVGMDPLAKEKIKQDVGNYYNALYGEDSISTKVRGFMGGFFQPPVTFAKLAVYIIGTTTLTTGVYAGVAPESFSQTSKAVSTTVQNAVTTSLEVLNIKPKVSDDSITKSQNDDSNDRMTKGQSDDSNDIFDDNSSDDINHDLFDDKGGERNNNNSDDRFYDNSRDDDDDRFDDKGGDRVRNDNRIEVKTSNSGKGSNKNDERIKITPIITLRTGVVNTGYVAPVVPKKDSRDYSDDNDDESHNRSDDRDDDDREDEDHEDRNRGGDSDDDREEHDD